MGENEIKLQSEIERKTKKIHSQKTTEIIDTETGELKSLEDNKTSYVEREPDYVKIYISDIVRLKGLPPTTDKVIMEIIRNMGYNNIFPAYAPIKKMMIERLGISMNTLNKAIQRLYDEGILVRMDRGVYLVDPHLFARGKWNDVRNLRLVIEYDTDGKRKLSSNAPEKLRQMALPFQE